MSGSGQDEADSEEFVSELTNHEAFSAAFAVGSLTVSVDGGRH
jgi:hypothetical protein